MKKPLTARKPFDKLARYSIFEQRQLTQALPCTVDFRFRVLTRVVALLWMLLGFVLGFCGRKLCAADSNLITPEEKELQSHGLAPTPAACLKFLQEGFPPSVDVSKLPETPPEKSQLAVDAMAILAKQRYRAAVDTLIRIAAQDLPKGVEQLLEFDLRHTAPDQRQQFRQRGLEILQYNAVNSLGLIGDKRALPQVRAVYEKETRTAPKIQYALALACLGDAHGVDFLVRVIQEQNRRESAAAAKAFSMITGQDFGYTDQTPIKKRRQLARTYQLWWAQNRQTFSLEPEKVLERRLAPPPPASYTPRTTRDLLRLSSQYFDLEEKPKVLEAREKIAAAGPALNPELEKIMFDELEDLNIRLEAMNWYYEINRSKAREAFRRLRRDANPEVVDKAKLLLEKIENPETISTSLP